MAGAASMAGAYVHTLAGAAGVAGAAGAWVIRTHLDSHLLVNLSQIIALTLVYCKQMTLRNKLIIQRTENTSVVYLFDLKSEHRNDGVRKYKTEMQENNHETETT